MFIGHFAMGFAAKRLNPRTRLGTFLLAAQLPDVIWPCLVLAGIERVAVAPGDTSFTPLRFEHYPFSHSLLLAGVWGGLFGLAYLWRRRDSRGASLIALLGVSHWLLDFVSHRADLPLVSWSPRVVGLGLWNSVPATFLIEGTLFVAGVGVYAAVTGGVKGRGTLALSVLVGALLALYAANVVSPPPPSPEAVAVAGVVLAPLVWVWANWVDRRRSMPA